MTDFVKPDYYQLELDDMVIALENKDYEIEQLKELLKTARYCLLDGCNEEDEIRLLEAIDEVLK